MSNIVNPNFDYTYNGQLTTDIFIKPAVMNPDVLRLFTVMQGINYKRQLNIGVPLGKVMKGEQGCGTQVVTANPVTITNRTLEVCAWEAYIEQCWDTFEATILGELLNNNIREPELIGTQIGSYIERLIREAIQRDIFRVFSFGDTSSVDPHYNKCDGLWTRLTGASDYDVPSIDTISSLTAATVKGYFKNLYEQAPNILRQLPSGDKKFFVTQNIYDSLMTYYEDNSNLGGFVAREENGVTSLRYRGIEVVPILAWDEWISTDNLGNNSRILYTTPKNHVIGVQEARTMGNVDVWYDKETKYNKYRARFKMGYNFIHTELQAYSIGNV